MHSLSSTTTNTTTPNDNYHHRSHYHPQPQQQEPHDGGGITRIVSNDSCSTNSSATEDDNTSSSAEEEVDDQDNQSSLRETWSDDHVSDRRRTHHRPPPQSLMPSESDSTHTTTSGETVEINNAVLGDPPPLHHHTHAPPQKKKKKKKFNVKRILFRIFISTTMVGSVSFVAIDFFTNQYLKAALGDFLDWMTTHGTAGSFAFIGIFIVASLVFFPPSLLQLGIGWVYTEAFGVTRGIFLGTLVSYVGCTLGASIAFCRSRYMMRGLVKRFAKRYSIIRAVDTAIKTEGFRIYLLLRLSPVVPFNALNYIGGITGITFRVYFESMIGILPKTILTVFIGASAGTAGDKGLNGEDRNVAMISTIVGSILGFLVVVYTSVYARKELNKIILKQQVEGALEEAEEDEGDHSVEVILQMQKVSSLEDGMEEEKTEELSTFTPDSSIEVGGMPLNTRTRYEVNPRQKSKHHHHHHHFQPTEDQQQQQQLTRYDVPYDQNSNDPNLRYLDSGTDDSDDEDTEWFWVWT
mmetsp:Transcript_7011/g.9902  ORF Transcript_7011/g.9902 Transcript_7011/m.9902 type:complete len:522 (+) Transcript_7011:1013-2578(+)